ncbi:TetR/AcrR family transcriptional regulator [Paenibacillus aurantius]|uniref:TetR/AcrR family transcriptional regulator n=1 Tax=Paenibacillus aurantius TaxID=2918900 RepID=A0AA96RD58_9BACL|nr:TetR/AcrR family transcriptional regulator [Paenibacillus aurantius]WNQ09447.1 TetR/AcrR family transcriptional regulator [Paenibacillus aurantius]
MSRETRKARTREDIVRRAVELFKRKGYDQVTVEEITTACGIAKGTFFNYFPRKEHLLLHLSETYLPLMTAIIERHAEGDWKDRLQRIFSDLTELYFRHYDLLRRVLAETVRSALEAGEESANLAVFRNKLASLLEEGKKTGQVRSEGDAGSAASVLLALYMSSLLQGKDRDSVMASMRAQLNTVWEGIGGGKSS